MEAVLIAQYFLVKSHSFKTLFRVSLGFFLPLFSLLYTYIIYPPRSLYIFIEEIYNAVVE